LDVVVFEEGDVVCGGEVAEPEAMPVLVLEYCVGVLFGWVLGIDVSPSLHHNIITSIKTRIPSMHP
jgi:hypothetical protein